VTRVKFMLLIMCWHPAEPCEGGPAFEGLPGYSSAEECMAARPPDTQDFRSFCVPYHYEPAILFNQAYCERMDRFCVASIPASVDGDSQEYQHELQKCADDEARCLSSPPRKQ
jgi:hypothetical protein